MKQPHLSHVTSCPHCGCDDITYQTNSSSWPANEHRAFACGHSVWWTQRGSKVTANGLCKKSHEFKHRRERHRAAAEKIRDLLVGLVTAGQLAPEDASHIMSSGPMSMPYGLWDVLDSSRVDNPFRSKDDES